MLMQLFRGAPPAGRAGVSLLTILLALACMAIVAGFAIPAFFGMQGVTLDNAARLLARDLRVAQNMAAFDGQPCTFEFLDEGRGWRVTGEDGNVLGRPDQKGNFERDFTTDGVFEGVRLAHIDFGGKHSLRFDKAGRALPGGTLQVTFNGEMRVVRVFALSGRVILNGLAEEYYDAH
jgi:Tfp pilus assembly protein FimT